MIEDNERAANALERAAAALERMADVQERIAISQGVTLGATAAPRLAVVETLSPVEQTAEEPHAETMQADGLAKGKGPD